MESRNFRLLWFGLLTSNVGTWMASTAEYWFVTQLEPERASLYLGLIFASFGVPMLLLPPVGGALADRIPRLRLLWTAQTGYVVINAALTIVTLTGVIEVWMLMVYAGCNGVILAMENPTRQALVPDLVTPAQLTSAISLNAAVFTGAGLIGPAIAGLLIPLVGVGGVFLVNTISYASVMWALAHLRDVPQHSSRPGPRRGIFATIGDGLRYIGRTPVVLSLLLVSFIAGLFGRSYVSLLAVFARDIFDAGATAYGLMVAAPGLGTLVGALFLATRRDEIARRGSWVVASATAYGVAVLAFALTGRYEIALVLLVLTGVFGTVVGALIATLLNLGTPPELRGRVMSFYTLTVIGVPSIGGLLAGVTADATGPRVAIAAGAVLVVLLIGVIWWRSPHLRTAP